MTLVLLVIQITLAVLLILLILLQQSSNDGVSSMASSPTKIGTSGPRSASSFLSKSTAILAALFMLNSLLLANVVAKKNGNNSSIEKAIEKTQKTEDKTISVPMAE